MGVVDLRIEDPIVEVWLCLMYATGSSFVSMKNLSFFFCGWGVVGLSSGSGSLIWIQVRQILGNCLICVDLAQLELSN